MNAPNHNHLPEKACEFIRLKASPQEVRAFTNAADGNLSGWFKQMANEQVQATHTPRPVNPRRTLL